MEFRYAGEQDAALILHFIRELAIYENMLDDVVATEELLREWIFEKKKAEVIFALEEGKEGPAQAAGPNRSGARLRQAGMVLSGLEQAEHRLLSFAGRAAHAGVDGVPAHGRYAARHGALNFGDKKCTENTLRN